MVREPIFMQHRVTGLPLNGVTAVVLACDSLNRPRAGPTVQGVGGGFYLVTFRGDDEAMCTIARLDFGANALQRYVVVVAFRNDNENQAWAVVVTDAAGVLWTGAAPTVGEYVWDDGTDRIGSAPTTVHLTELGPVYLWRPTREDAEEGASIRVDAPAGSSSTVWVDRTQPVAPITTSLGESLFAAMTADAGVSALVGTRMFPGQLPQNEIVPALVYHVITDPFSSSLTTQAAPILRAARVQVDAYARTYKEAHAVQLQVERVMTAMRAPSPGLSAVQETARDLFDSLTGYHRVQMEFTVWR